MRAWRRASRELGTGAARTGGSLARYYLCNQGRAANFFVALMGKKDAFTDAPLSEGKERDFNRHWARRNRFRIRNVR